MPFQYHRYVQPLLGAANVCRLVPPPAAEQTMKTENAEVTDSSCGDAPAMPSAPDASPIRPIAPAAAACTCLHQEG